MSLPDLGALARQLNPRDLKALAGHLQRRAKLTEKASVQLTKLAREMERMDAEIASFCRGNEPNATPASIQPPARAARGSLAKALREILGGLKKGQALSLEQVKDKVKRNNLPVGSVSTYLSKYSKKTGDHRWFGYNDDRSQ